MGDVMTEAAKEKRRAYYKTWRAENQEKVREYKRKYREAHREEINAYYRTWRAENPEKVREYNSRYWENKALD